jgi:hypothetical protein
MIELEHDGIVLAAVDAWVPFEVAEQVLGALEEQRLFL